MEQCATDDSGKSTPMAIHRSMLGGNLRCRPMPIYDLDPLDLTRPHWHASTHTRPCRVHAIDERRARQYADDEFRTMTDARDEEGNIATSPWLRPDLVFARIEAEGSPPGYWEGLIEVPQASPGGAFDKSTFDDEPFDAGGSIRWVPVNADKLPPPDRDAPERRAGGYARFTVPTPTISGGGATGGGAWERDEALSVTARKSLAIGPAEEHDEAGSATPVLGSNIERAETHSGADAAAQRAAKTAEAPRTVIASAETALATTVVLQDLFASLRLNAEEASEVSALLERQRVVLGGVVAALQSGKDSEPARKDAAALLTDILHALLRNCAADGPVRGFLATAAITLASVLGADLHPVTQAIVATSFVGVEVAQALRGIIGGKGKGG